MFSLTWFDDCGFSFLCTYFNNGSKKVAAMGPKRVKNQNRRQKVLNTGFEFAQGKLTFWKFDKIFTDL